MTVVYAASAVTDLKHIWEHYAERATKRVTNDVIRRIQKDLETTIGRQKRARRPRPEFGRGFRSIPVAPYVAFYVVDSRGAQEIGRAHV